MGAAEIEQFLTDLAVNGHVAAGTQNQAFHALLFLYQQVLGIELPRLDSVRAKRPARLPTFLSPGEVGRLLNRIRGGEGTFRLMAGLLYGAGLRREECCRVRVHDLDLYRDQLVVRHGKGGKDRVVMLPRALRPELDRQIEWRRDLHARDVTAGLARGALPDALARKYPRAAPEFGWQFLFARPPRARGPTAGGGGPPPAEPGPPAPAGAGGRRRGGGAAPPGRVPHPAAQLRHPLGRARGGRADGPAPARTREPGDDHGVRPPGPEAAGRDDQPTRPAGRLHRREPAGGRRGEPRWRP